MIESFEDFCTWMYVIVDDLWQEIAPQFVRPGPPPLCSDSELLTLALVGECRGWVMETRLLSHFREYRSLFPHLPSQSRFNRRRRHLAHAFNAVRRAVLAVLDVAQDRHCALDSVPVPVVHFHLVPSTTGDWAEHGASFGKVPSKKMTIYGYKLHTLVTLGGVLRDFVLAPAHASDLSVGQGLLAEHTDLTVVADKAYISAAIAQELQTQNRVILLTVPRRNQHVQLPAAVTQRLNAVRQIIETVNGQLTDQFHLAINHAHTFHGLCTRLLTKLAAHTLSIYLNRLLGQRDFLHIIPLAFPN